MTQDPNQTSRAAASDSSPKPSDDGLYMPADPAAPQGAPGGEEPGKIPPPPSFGKQVAQLIVIPAVIVVAAIGVALLFGKIGGTRDSLKEQITRLEQSSGSGKIGFGVQDPRYKDRWQAANNIAEMLRTMRDPGDRVQLNEKLVKVLREHVAPEEHDLRIFLVLALASLGQESGLDAILSHAESPDARVREIVATATAGWVEHAANGREGLTGERRTNTLNTLAALTRDETPNVAREAVRVLGFVAGKDDETAVAAIRAAMGREGRVQRGVTWNAAIALARWGDELGSQLVASQLLSREALSQMPAEEGVTVRGADGSAVKGIGGGDGLMPPDQQDMVLATTLAATDAMTDPVVWSRVRQLAENDPNRVVRSLAKTMVDRHGGGK